MKLLAYIILLVSISLPTIAEEAEKSTEVKNAESWLNRLSQSLNTLNFSTSFVVVKNNHAEPYHWFHGVDETGNQLEILSLLNGPRRDVLRKGNVVSYIEPELPPYSIIASHLKGPIPNILRGDISLLSKAYDFNLVGKSRILGRSAQLIRIVSKENNRYGYWLWLDQQTGLLLKLAIVTKKGQLLEQIQFTHLEITESASLTLTQLQTTELPKTLEIPKGYQQQSLSWQVNWLPEGFERINANRHKINATQQKVEFMLFSDGLVDVSVYINPSSEQRAVDFVMDGATVALNQALNGFEISVVGKIPSKTAKRIANSVALLPRSKP